MTYAIDANTLLFAADRASSMHAVARDLVRRVIEGPELVYVFWPVLMAYVRVSTSPAIFANPLTPEEAVTDVETLLGSPYVRTGAEAANFWNEFRAAVRGVPLRGNIVPDAHIAGLMRQHGVSTIYTHDRDFRKFEGIRVIDPFV
ncbi:MAG: PIN domain-containing protein [Thermoflexaceae bacterium]|nr:PIN domain-containing protein [Thermoflexaceae bacterium]